MTYRFKRFTEKANTALNLSIEAAREMGHTYVGTEHILLGLIREGTSAASQVLANHGIEEDRVLALIEKLIAPASPVHMAEPGGYSPRAARVL